MVSKALRQLLSVALALVALAAMAATAQGLTLSNEGGSACPAVTANGTDVDGGCLTHATSEGKVELRKHVFGIESHITHCNNEFAGRFESNGTGKIFEQKIDGFGCSRQACQTLSAGGIIWSGSFSENTSGVSPQGYLSTNFCLEPVGGGTDETCEIDIPFNAYSGEHRQEYGQVGEMSSHGITGFRCEVVGHWNSETGGTHDGDAEQEIAIAH